MPLFLDLTPEIEARLQEEATSHGLTVSELVTLMVRGADGEAGTEPQPEQSRPSAETLTNKEPQPPAKESLEDILDNMILALKTNQIAYRELVVQVITQKNNFQAEADRAKRLIGEYERKAAQALEEGNSELSGQFLKEKTLYEKQLPDLEREAQAATTYVERIKAHIKDGEERIRRRIADISAMKFAFKQIELELFVSRALDQFRLTDDEVYWKWLRERVRSLQTQARAVGAEIQVLLFAKVEETNERVSDLVEKYNMRADTSAESFDLSQLTDPDKTFMQVEFKEDAE